MKKSFLIIFLGVLLGSWGYVGHKTLQGMAVDIIQRIGEDEEIISFFRTNKDYLVKNSIRPDERRREDKTEAPKHFLDMDAEVFGEDYLQAIPHNKQEAIEKYGMAVFEKEGMVQWEVPRVYRKLVDAFRQNNKDSILFYAADLGHYVSDAHVPLHATKNYDGQLTGQKGAHALWESLVVENLKISESIDWMTLSKEDMIIENVDEEIWKILEESNGMVLDLLEKEKEVSKGFTEETKFYPVERNGRTYQYYTKEFINAYGKEVGGTVEKRMKESAISVARFWWTAYKESEK
ncbi:MAG: hypothetical protein RIR51_1362 [Bacteroidota bacterium]|jgi:hypothetical protein